MAEPPLQGLHASALDQALRGAETVAGHMFVDLSAHGPAGSSSFELPGGQIIEVDHLVPSRLVGVQLESDDPAASPLLVALFGGEGALRLADVAASGGGDPALRLEPDGTEYWGPPMSRPRGRAGPAARAGRLVLLADLATDPFAAPLARVAATAELVSDASSVEGGDLFVPVVPHLATGAVGQLDEIDDAEVEGLEPEVAHALADLLGPLAAVLRNRKHAAVLLSWEVRLRSVEPEMLVAASLAPSVRRLPRDEMDDDEWDEGDLSAVADSAPPAPAPPDGTHLVRRTPSLLEVTVQRSDRPRWVRALRTDGLVAVSLAPMVRDGLVDRSELLVPPDTPTDELQVQVLDAWDVSELAEAPAGLVRRAVRVGRAAASAERSRERWSAHRRWQRCSELWREAGDVQRSWMAEARTGTGVSRLDVEPILADELDPYGVEVDLEGVLR